VHSEQTTLPSTNDTFTQRTVNKQHCYTEHSQQMTLPHSAQTTNDADTQRTVNKQHCHTVQTISSDY